MEIKKLLNGENYETIRGKIQIVIYHKVAVK